MAMLTNPALPLAAANFEDTEDSTLRSRITRRCDPVHPIAIFLLRSHYSQISLAPIVRSLTDHFSAGLSGVVAEQAPEP
jgi:hypothetical protein